MAHYFRFVTEVFYARAIDVSLFGSGSFGGVLETAKPVQPVDSSDGNDVETSNEPSGDDFTGVIDSSAGSNSEDFLSSIKSNLGRTQTVPGGAIQFLSASERSIGMRRVYDRPIAIGFRAVTVKYDLCNNEPDSNNDSFVLKASCVGSIDSVVVSSSGDSKGKLVARRNIYIVNGVHRTPLLCCSTPSHIHHIVIRWLW